MLLRPPFSGQIFVIGMFRHPCWLLLLGCVYLSGCALGRPKIRSQSQSEGIPNPLFIAAQNEELLWEQLVDVLHEDFQIARENRLDGVIETQPKTAAGVLEPWHRDSVGLEQRLEGSLQSLRRRAFVHVTPGQGGYLVSIEVFKEQEDVPQDPDKSAGGSTFQESRPLQRDLTLVVGESTPQGWIPLGRDMALEQKMLGRLQKRIWKASR